MNTLPLIEVEEIEEIEITDAAEPVLPLIEVEELDAILPTAA